MKFAVKFYVAISQATSSTVHEAQTTQVSTFQFQRPISNIDRHIVSPRTNEWRS